LESLVAADGISRLHYQRVDTAKAEGNAIEFVTLGGCAEFTVAKNYELDSALRPTLESFIRPRCIR
jgi:hypothetical protein